MVVKVELKEFGDRNECKNFINNFIKDKKLRQTKFLPLIKKNKTSYVVYIEYDD